MPIIEEMIVMSRKDIQKEACWTICNIVCGGSMQQVKSLIQQYDVPQMVSKLVNSDKDHFGKQSFPSSPQRASRWTRCCASASRATWTTSRSSRSRVAR